MAEGTGETRGARPRFAFATLVVVLPALAFAWLAIAVHTGGVAFDRPLLELAHAQASPRLGALALLLDKIGYQYGVVPFDIGLVLFLALRRRWREALFATFAFVGSALFNIAAKHLVARVRPELWPSQLQEQGYSFPSGHAMGAMTLAMVLAMLAWPTRWRWPMALGGFAFALVVGASRVWLGVHYPSDVLAGWAAALAWTILVQRVLARGQASPRR